MLEARGLVKSYRAPDGAPIRVLDGVDLTVERGRLAVVLGASGSGKSTLLNVLGLLEDADGGALRLGGAPVSALRRSARSRARGRYVGFVFLHRVQRQPHRGFPAAVTQSLARLVVHLDRHIGMDDPRGAPQSRSRLQQRLDRGAVAEQQEFGIGVTLQGYLGSRHDYRRANVAPHGVERDTDLMGHGSTLAAPFDAPELRFSDEPGDKSAGQ